MKEAADWQSIRFYVCTQVHNIPALLSSLHLIVRNVCVYLLMASLGLDVNLAYYVHMCLVTVRVADLIAQGDPSKLYPSCAELNVYGIKQILRIVTSRT